SPPTLGAGSRTDRSARGGASPMGGPTVGEVAVRVEERLPRRRDAAPRARALVAEALGNERAGAADPVWLVVTELVANAVRHGGGGRIAFRMEADGGRILGEVENRCWSARPRRRLAAPGRPTGRGLALVAALSESWGVSPAPRGRARVWAELSAEPAAT